MDRGLRGRGVEERAVVVVVVVEMGLVSTEAPEAAAHERWETRLDNQCFFLLASQLNKYRRGSPFLLTAQLSPNL